ncbi:MAG: ABC transporter ATP-binding protein [Candidatus Dormibacteraeota bacterium]|nr:ABC transporter ATP-binding protein [Candidatus Dormibacteraeota bacterium]MBV9524615.1 ABC transporter ATP-binding protein [Candidatus Dormibacteraeota bacterium]
MTTTTSAAPLVETRGLTRRFGARAAIDGVDLRIPSGVAFGLLGPNGAGKTTLIRVLLGLIKPSAGDAWLMGHAMPAEHAAALASVGAVVEEPRFHTHLTGRENLAIVAACISDAAEARIPSVLARVGLAERADERVGTYSLGMRQRLGIARCLLNDPQLLILDEPMNGLDPAGMLEVRDFIRSFVDEGRTVLLSSHLLDEMERTCDMVAIIDRGHLVRQGRLSELRGGENRVIVECSDVARARTVLQSVNGIEHVAGEDSRTLVCTLPDGTSPAQLNRALVTAGIDVSRLERSQASLEERFLDLTTRLQTPEEAIA